jgi:hypothetical protein
MQARIIKKLHPIFAAQYYQGRIVKKKTSRRDIDVRTARIDCRSKSI